MLPKLRLVTFRCAKNLEPRVGILQDNKSVIDLSKISKEPAFMDMLKFIEADSQGKHNTLTDEAKKFAKNPPPDSLVAANEVFLLAPIPLPRLSNNHAAATKFVSLDRWVLRWLSCTSCRRNVFCIGKNYIDHIAEVAKATTALVGKEHWRT